jgi:hypothetical protein
MQQFFKRPLAQALGAALFFSAALPAGAAEATDAQIARACSGLSSAFYEGSKIEEPDATERNVLLLVSSDTDSVALFNRAKISGAALACGVEAAAPLQALKKEATAMFSKDAALSKRFVKVLDCSAARHQKFGLESRWATTPQTCPQARANFTFYVQERRPFNVAAPEIEAAPSR